MTKRDFQEGTFRVISHKGGDVLGTGTYRLCERIRSEGDDSIIQVAVNMSDSLIDLGWIVVK